MKITDVKSHVLQYPLDKELGYSQGYFDRRTAHIVEVFTDEGILGVGEAYGGGQVALANKAIVERVIQPMIVGEDPLDRKLGFPSPRTRVGDRDRPGICEEVRGGLKGFSNISGAHPFLHISTNSSSSG